MESQNARLIRYLSSGNTISGREARSKFGIKNLRARVLDLRNLGFCVYTNYSNGVTRYRLGSPSRAMVSIAYRVAGSRPFNSR